MSSRHVGVMDDAVLADYVEMSAGTVAAPIGTTATDLTVDGAGGTGPSCPAGYTMVFDYVSIENPSASTVQVTLQKVKASGTAIPVLTVALATKTSEVVDQSRFKVICPAGYRLQVVSDTAASAVVNALARLVKGASASP